MILSNLKTRIAPEFEVDRLGSSVSISFHYVLAASASASSAAKYSGSAAVKLGASEGSVTQSGASSDISIGFSVNVTGAKSYAGSMELHDNLAGLHIGYNFTVTAFDKAASYTARGGTDLIFGSRFADTLNGSGGRDLIEGNGGNDTLFGGAGNDTLWGQAGNDKLEGGAGRDLLYGGAGADRFIFRTGDTGTTRASADTIFDFSVIDKIDLSHIDADTHKAGNQVFSGIVTKAFDGHSAMLRYEKLAHDTYIYGDTNGDRHADFAIHLTGAFKLVSDEFIL